MGTKMQGSRDDRITPGSYCLPHIITGKALNVITPPPRPGQEPGQTDRKRSHGGAETQVGNRKKNESLVTNLLAALAVSYMSALFIVSTCARTAAGCCWQRSIGTSSHVGARSARVHCWGFLSPMTSRAFNNGQIKQCVPLGGGGGRPGNTA